MRSRRQCAAAGAAILATMLLALPAAAQTEPLPPGTVDGDGQKKNETVPGTKPDDNKPLSEKLGENEGVLKPPAKIDPEMQRLPPKTTKDTMPVIIPPGEPGGDQSVQPK